MPEVEDLAIELNGRARVVLVEVEKEGPTLEAFDATRVPTYLIYRDGVEVDRFAPFVFDGGTQNRLRKKVEAALAEASTN